MCICIEIEAHIYIIVTWGLAQTGPSMLHIIYNTNIQNWLPKAVHRRVHYTPDIPELEDQELRGTLNYTRLCLKKKGRKPRSTRENKNMQLHFGIFPSKKSLGKEMFTCLFWSKTSLLALAGLELKDSPAELKVFTTTQGPKSLSHRRLKFSQDPTMTVNRYSCCL